ncbi:aspartate/glutamate racemase family protein [Franzmannia qiaohouensis]|uniref:Aspartate/glutamate racemase family protein n=1 Tax=Franzmannia qiaohouensis TaxID=1329370 RepID=A0ABU1HB08_9GAMM|nr:aspartate/glutamate racemase family protein [Halomonas qiaohouensis]MDR5903840.1 aspartate/glutamate racemase family protein [Halomonas qiaohouensis]
MRLLLLNGNANLAMTDQMAAKARGLLGPGVEVVAETAVDSVAYIASRRDCALSAAAVVGLAEDHLVNDPERFDAILLACFGEPGISAVREISTVPVVGMLEASVLSALQLGGRFSVITPGQRWPRMIEDQLNDLGVARHCLGIDAIAIDDLVLPAQRDLARQRLVATLEAQRSRLAPDVVIVGGAAFAGLATQLAPAKECRVIDCLEAALAQVQAMLTLTAQGRHADPLQPT